MTDAWTDLIHGDQWVSPDTLWVEDGTEYSWARVSELASTVEEAIRAHGAVRVVTIRSASKLGCFAGQLGAWRAGCVAVADPGTLGPTEADHVRPDLTLSVTATVTTAGASPVELVGRADGRLPAARIPDEVVTVNFTSGSTGSRKAVAVTRGNLLTLFACRDLDVPVSDERLAAGSFATPAFDGWWFDTWRTVSAGGVVVCLPGVNDDVFAWPELAKTYHIDRLLLPAAVLAAIVEAAPECVADIPWLFSGGEQFRVSTYQQARRNGLNNRFVNLYGPTEATFATHRYDLPEDFAAAAIPIGKPLDGCQQRLYAVNGRTDDAFELVIEGPSVCLGYLENGTIARRFGAEGGQPSYRTADVVRVEDGNLVFAGRLDSQIKVNGIRVDAAALEHQVTGLPDVFDCRVVQNEWHTVAFVRADAASWPDLAARSRIESVVRGFSPAITVRLVDSFPTKSGGKVDVASLMDQLGATTKDGER